MTLKKILKKMMKNLSRLFENYYPMECPNFPLFPPPEQPLKEKKMVTRKKKPAAKPAQKTDRVKIGKGLSIKRGKEEKLSKKPGSSSIGSYKKVPEGDFCGPSGGAAPGTYPVHPKKRCMAALAYAKNAPNPAGIRACVKRKCKRPPSKKK